MTLREAATGAAEVALLPTTSSRRACILDREEIVSASLKTRSPAGACKPAYTCSGQKKRPVALSPSGTRFIATNQVRQNHTTGRNLAARDILAPAYKHFSWG